MFPVAAFAASRAQLTLSASGPVIQGLTNAEKLALDSATAVGTQVNVTDAVLVTGPAGESDAVGVYVPIGLNATGEAPNTQVYKNFETDWFIGIKAFRTDPDGGGAQTIQWGIFRPDNDPFTFDGSTGWSSPAYWGTQGDTSETPDLVEWNTSGEVDRPPFAEPPVPTVTLGAIQELATPSTAQAGVFVSGGNVDGIYTKNDTLNGKDAFTLLGADRSDTPNSIRWIDDLEDFSPSASGFGFLIRDNVGAGIYYSLSNVATPDLASNWKNGSDDSAAPITVTSVTQGELYAGLSIANDGITNGSSYVSQPFHWRQYYMGLNGGGSNNMHWDTDFNVWTDDVGVWTTNNVAFPWQGADDHSGHNGATFARNNVANEANWDAA